jgi:hypothetical protein
MTSKWIEEAMSKYPTGNDVYWDSNGMLEILERINDLLLLAGSLTTIDKLAQMIEKETFDSEATVKINVTELGERERKTITGISSVIPITDAEAERIFREVGDAEENLRED